MASSLLFSDIYIYYSHNYYFEHRTMHSRCLRDGKYRVHSFDGRVAVGGVKSLGKIERFRIPPSFEGLVHRSSWITPAFLNNFFLLRSVRRKVSFRLECTCTSKYSTESAKIPTMCITYCPKADPPPCKTMPIYVLPVKSEHCSRGLL